MKRKEKVELTVSIDEILQFIKRSEDGYALPEKVLVLPLHGKEPDYSSGTFSAIRISWVKEGA